MSPLDMEKESSDFERVVVTGASGWLAQELTNELNQLNRFEVIGVSRKADPSISRGQMIGNNQFLEDFKLNAKDVVVHCAFARESVGGLLTDSLRYSGEIFVKAFREGASVVNVSSQSVYGCTGGLSNTEEDNLSPDYLYALAKASSEVLLDVAAATGQGKEVYYTNLRLASLMGVSGGVAPDNILGKFIDRAVAGLPIEITGGSQKFSFLDIHDAVRAIIVVLSARPSIWNFAYNVTPSSQIGITEMASMVVNCVARRMCTSPVDIHVKASDIVLDPGASNVLIERELSWSPLISIEQIIEETVDLKLSERMAAYGAC